MLYAVIACIHSMVVLTFLFLINHVGGCYAREEDWWSPFRSFSLVVLLMMYTGINSRMEALQGLHM